MKNNMKQNIQKNSHSVGNEENNTKKGLMDFLTKDRGNTNFKKIFEKIPADFYEQTGFVIVMMMMGLLLVEEVYRIFFDNPKLELYIKFFYLVGAFGEIFAVIYIISAFYNKKKQSLREMLETHIWDLALVLMLVWSTLSAVFAKDNYFAIKGTTYRHDGLYTYYVYASMYVCARAVKSKKLRVWLLRVMGITVTCLSLMSIPQTSFDLMRKWGKIGENLYKYGIYSSIFYNLNHFGYILVIGLMALAGLVIIEKKVLQKILWLAMFGLDIWALILNNTFGSYVAVMFGILFLAVIMLIGDKERYKSVIAVVTVFIAVSVGMDAYNHTLSENFGLTYKESTEITTNDGAGSGRIGLWKQAVKYIKEKPVFGFGPEGLTDRYWDDGFTNDRPHNEFIQHAVFLGIPALAFYLVALISVFWYCIKRIRKLSPCMLAAGGIVFGYCVSAFFGNTMYYTTPYYFVFLGMLSACYLEKTK